MAEKYSHEIIAQNLQTIRRGIEQAAEAVGRSPQSVKSMTDMTLPMLSCILSAACRPIR